MATENSNLPLTIRGVVAGIEQELIDARTLHAELHVGNMFPHWIKRRITELDLFDGVHFCKVAHRPNNGTERQSFDYLLLPVVALRMALMQRSYSGSHSTKMQDLQHQVNFLRERFYAQNPEYVRVARFLAIEGLSDEERVNLMGWTEKQWTSAVAELRSARMIEISPLQAVAA
jgi:phage anti-repressor protein